MPESFLERVGKAHELNESSWSRQRPVRDTLVSLFPLLRQLVWLRKQLAERMLQACRHAQQQVAAGAALPLVFQYTDSLPWVVQHEQTSELRKREIPLHFVLWNRRTWVLHHQDRYTQSLIRSADTARGRYSPAQDQYFVQFVGDPRDLLWFGKLVDQRLLLDLHHHDERLRDPTSTERVQLARELGFSGGCYTSHNGLLRVDARWFAEHTRNGDVLFEPESCYRGILYGAALALLALTNGGSLGELLQVSANRWEIAPQGRQQLLLPDKAKSDEERRLFPISPEAGQLLDEIERGLVEVYGEIPAIPSIHQLSMADRLSAERYLFQWQRRMIDGHDIQVLVRFLLHGVALSAPNGSPLRFTLDLLRDGGNGIMQERSQELLSVFGFNQTILDLTASSQETYCRDFHAYWQFAGSKEAALRALTLARWIVHLKRLHYKTSTIDRMVNEIQQLFTAAAEKGHIDHKIAAAFHIESIQTERPASSKTPDSTTPHITFSQTFKKCGKLACSVCRDGKGHGPYWIANWREDGKGHSVYIGRTKNEHTVTEGRRKIELLRGQEAGTPAQPARDIRVDELAPLVPTLYQLVLQRKHLAERILFAIREAVLQVDEQRVELPYRFQHADTIPELHFDPQTTPLCGTIEERVVILTFSLWDKRSWILAHQDRYSPETIRRAQKGSGAYSDERNTRFVQFHGHPRDFLWIGDLVEGGLLRVLLPDLARDEESRRRDRVARNLGFPRGCHNRRPGLLDTGDRWFSENARLGELVFEPEALYRGVLYGAALAILSLSGGLTVSELQQVSADRWIVETAGGMHGDWSETGPSALIHLQSLVPDGASAQDKRRLYPISPQAKGLLDEISAALEHAHGEIPVIPAFRQTKQKVLGPERYLFQWQEGAIGTKELTMLKRFVLHGLKWPTGERLRIGAQLLPESHTVPAAQDDRELERLRDRLLAPLASQLAPSSLKSYQSSLDAYVRFADSEEQAFQPETLRRWIAHLAHKQPKPCGPVTIAQKAALVRKSMVEAGRLGHLDRELAKEFNKIRTGRVDVASRD